MLKKTSFSETTIFFFKVILSETFLRCDLYCGNQKFEDTNRVIRSCIIQYNDQKWPKVLKRKNNYNCIYETYIEESMENCIIVEMFYNTDWQIKLNCYWNFLYLVNMFYSCQKFLITTSLGITYVNCDVWTYVTTRLWCLCQF